MHQKYLLKVITWVQYEFKSLKSHFGERLIKWNTLADVVMWDYNSCCVLLWHLLTQSKPFLSLVLCSHSLNSVNYFPIFWFIHRYRRIVRKDTNNFGCIGPENISIINNYSIEDVKIWESPRTCLVLTEPTCVLSQLLCFAAAEKHCSSCTALHWASDIRPAHLLKYIIWAL